MPTGDERAMRRSRICSCYECLVTGAPTVDGSHTFRLIEDENHRLGLAWRAVCECGSFRGHWQYQSVAVSYHSWLRHVAQAKKAGKP